MSKPIIRKPVYEYESSFSIKISQEWFEILKQVYRMEKVKILWYYDDETRFTDSMFQKKKPLKPPTRVLKLLSKNIFIPMSRTTSVEILTPVNLDFGSITAFISRYTFVHYNKTIRFCLESRATAHGGSFYLCGEIEYEKEIFHNYELLMKEENTLMNLVEQKFGHYLAVMVSEEKSYYEKNFTRIEPERMSSIPSRRFSKFYQEKPLLVGNLVAIVYKFDGFKARMYCGARNQIYYLDDMKVLGQIDCSLFNTTPFLIYQMEIMTNHVIITDVIGTYVGNQLYATEPLDTFRHFDYLKSFAIGKTLDVPHWGSLTILLQNKIDWTVNQELPTKEEMSIPLPFDGYIVISCNKIYKYKIPTIDVEMKNGSLFLRNATNALSIDVFKVDVENENGIYEICPHKKSYKILRKRFDRDFASTEEDFIEFEKEREYFQQYLCKLKDVNS